MIKKQHIYKTKSIFLFFVLANLFITSSTDMVKVWCMFSKAKPVKRSCPILDLNQVFNLTKVFFNAI